MRADKTASAFSEFYGFRLRCRFATVVLMSRNDKGIAARRRCYAGHIFKWRIVRNRSMPVPIKGMILVPDYLLAEMTGAESELGRGTGSS